MLLFQLSIEISLSIGKCAFVEFLDRSMAENAAKFLYNNLEIKGRSINVNWSKPKVISSSSSSSISNNNGSNDGMFLFFQIFLTPQVLQYLSSSY